MFFFGFSILVDGLWVGHVNQVGHLSGAPLNLLQIRKVGPVDESGSGQQNCDQVWHMWSPYQDLLRLSYVSWLSHSPVVYYSNIAVRRGTNVKEGRWDAIYYV